MLVGQTLKATAQRTPHAEAVADGESRWSYADWNTDVNRLANGLKKAGLRAGDRVACFLTNRAEFLMMMLATQKIGGISVPLNFRLTSPEVDIVASDCKPRAWCFESATNDSFSKSSVATDRNAIKICCDTGISCDVLFGDLLVGSSVDEPAVSNVSIESPSVIMYTSGTTGRPKGVVLSHQAQFINSLSMIAEFGLGPSDRALHIAPIYHVAAYHVVALPHILIGGTNILVRRYDPISVASVLEQERATNVLGAPTHYELWAARGSSPSEAALKQLRQVFVTGAPVRTETVRWIRSKLSPNLWNVYGQTESTSLITLLPPAEMERMGPINCIGRALVGMETRVVVPDAPIDLSTDEPEMGELIARGSKMMTEYFNAPEKTHAKLQDGWLRTGDLVRRDQDGYYYLLGRVDDLIITGAENVYPIEIEQAMAAHPDVGDCAVVGVPDPTWGQIIGAFVVPNGAKCDVRSIAAHLDARLANHKRPRRWAVIESIPRNPSGKVILRELRAQQELLRELSAF